MTEYTVVPKKFSDLHQRAKPHNARLLEALRENRERYRLLAQHISDVIWVADLDLNLLYYSPSIERLRGYTVEEALSHRFEEMVTPASLETARNLLAQVASLPESELRDPGLTRTVELEYLCKDGSTVWTEARVSFQHDQDGWPVALVGVTRDISERKQAEFERDATLDKLRKANALLDTLLQATPDVMYFKDAQGHNLIVNRAYEELVGLEKQDIIGKTDEQLLAPALAEQCQASDAQALQSRQTVRIEEQFTDDEGQTAFFDTLKVPILDDHGEVAGLVCISRDVTERVQMEKALQESEERLRLVVQNMPVMLDALDADNNFIVWNREAERVTGYRAEEIIGNPQALELLYPDAAYLQRALDEWTERGNAFRDRELQITHKDGAIKTVSWCNMSQQFPIPGWTAWAIGVDVTERVRAESQRDAMLKALQESEEQYRATIDAMGDSVHVVDDDLCLVLFNEAFRQAVIQAGIEGDPTGMQLAEFCPFLPATVHKEYAQVLASGKRLITEEATTIGQRAVWTETRKIPILGPDKTSRVVTIIRDITERKQANEMLGAYASQQAALFQLSANLAAILDEKGVCREVVRGLRDTLGYACLALLLLDESTGERVLYASVGFDGVVENWRIPPGQGLSERPLVDGRLHYTPDVTCNPVYLPGINKGSEVDVPLKLGDKVLGVLVAESIEPDGFDKGDLAVLTAAANQASVAVQRAREHQAVKQAQARYRSLFDDVPVGLFRATPEGQILDANPALVRIMGYPDRASLLDSNVADTYLDPDERSRWLARVEGEGMLRGWECELHRYDGQVIVAQVDTFAARDADGRTLYYEGNLQDVTGRVRAQQALRESEEKYRLLVENAHEAISAVNQAGEFTIVNNAAAGQIGCAPEDLIGKTLWDVLPKEIADSRMASARQVMQSGQGHVVETSNPVQGEIRWFRSSAQPIRDSAGNITSVLSLSTDITERVRAETELQRRNRELLLLNQASQAFSSSLNLDQVLNTVLKETCSLLGVAAGSVWLLDQETGDIVCQQDTGPRSDVVRGWRLSPGQGLAGWVIETGKSAIVPDTRQDARYFKDVADRMGIELRSILGVPLRVREKVIGALHVIDTVVDRFTLADLALIESLAATAAIAIENAQLYQRARQDAETRSTLLHEVNHRVKNNLTSILGILALEMERDVQNPDDFQAVMRDLQGRIRGLATVHDMLSATHWAPLPLARLVTQVIYAALSSSPQRQRIQVSVTPPPEPLLISPKQATALSVIINELTTNSVKYAFRGRNQGRIDVHIAADGADQRQVTLKFRNDGPGWPDDVLQGQRKSVGLHLVRINVRSPLRGEVRFHNDAGAATTITFTLAPLG